MGHVTPHNSCACHLALAPCPFPGRAPPSPPRALRSEEGEPKRREEGPSGLRSPKMGINRDNSGQRDGAERERGRLQGTLDREAELEQRGRSAEDRETDIGRQCWMPPQEHPTAPECRRAQPGPCLHMGLRFRLCPTESCEPLVASEHLCIGGRHQHFQKGDTQVPPAAGSFPAGTDPTHTSGVFPGTRSQLRPRGGHQRANSPTRESKE